MHEPFRRRLPWIGLCLALAGCGATEAYVYKAEEFDRSSPTFNQEPADLTEVSVCYNPMASRPADIAALAAAACERFGRRAEARDEGFGNCPLLTPVQARFDCRDR